MKARKVKACIAAALAACTLVSMVGCGKSKVELNDGTFK